MLPILELTTVLQGTMTSANIQIFLDLVYCFYCVPKNTTTRSLSRFSFYSLRHIFRFFGKKHDWISIRMAIFKSKVYGESKHYIAAIDETVESKSGKHSYGLDRFYSSIAKKAIPSVCFFAFSLIDVSTQASYFLNIIQVIYTEEDKKRIEAKKKEKKAGELRTKNGTNKAKGRKKGSQDSEKVGGKKVVENLSASYRCFKLMFLETMEMLFDKTKGIKITHLLGDSAYGTLDYLLLAKKYACFLISKLNKNTALFECAKQEIRKSGQRGAPKKYGDKIDLSQLKPEYLKETKTETKDNETITHQIYQFEAYNKSINGVKLNIVVQVSTRKDGKTSTTLWFTNDLELSYKNIIGYYSMRFQIEFDFRDAKQHFGLSDFKNYKQQNLTNFVNMSFTMNLVSEVILQKYRKESKIEKASIFDLKTIFHAQYIARNIIKLLQIPGCNKIYFDKISKYVPNEVINKV